MDSKPSDIEYNPDQYQARVMQLALGFGLTCMPGPAIIEIGLLHCFGIQPIAGLLAWAR